MTDKLAQNVTVLQFWLGVAVMLLGAGTAYGVASAQNDQRDKAIAAVEIELAESAKRDRALEADLASLKTDVAWIKQFMIVRFTPGESK